MWWCLQKALIWSNSLSIDKNGKYAKQFIQSPWNKVSQIEERMQMFFRTFSLHFDFIRPYRFKIYIFADKFCAVPKWYVLFVTRSFCLKDCKDRMSSLF